MLNHVLIAKNLDRVTTSQDLSLGALSFTTEIDTGFILEQITVHSSVVITETFNVSLDSITGANYDALIGAMDFDGTQDIALIGGENIARHLCFGGDQVKLECTADNATGIIYVTFKFQRIV